MAHWESRARLAVVPWVVMSLVGLHAPAARAQDLPAIRYTTADGLPSDEVIRVVRDPAGFLWVGTSNALARFDGRTFKSYGRNEGLDVATGVNDIRFGADGHLWISTNGNGIIRFDLNSREPLSQLLRLAVGTGRPTNRVNSFALTDNGDIWAATDAGLFVGNQQTGNFTRIDLVLPDGRCAPGRPVTC